MPLSARSATKEAVAAATMSGSAFCAPSKGVVAYCVLYELCSSWRAKLFLEGSSSHLHESRTEEKQYALLFYISQANKDRIPTARTVFLVFCVSARFGCIHRDIYCFNEIVQLLSFH